MSSRAFLTGVLVAGVAATSVLVTSSETDVLAGRPVADEIPVVGPGPVGDSMSTGRGADLTGLIGGANTNNAKPVEPTQQQPQQQQPAPPKAGPGSVRLPSGGSATLVRREVEDGVLPVPDGIGEATWWGTELAAAEGATVLAGHVDWKGAKGPFAELWQAQNGREVVIADSSGKEFRFRIKQIETVRKEELPARAVEFFGPRGPHRLVLVTCGGTWIGGQQGYEANRVVIAEPVA
ncbi:peptidase C60 sortase A and B [Lentzea guizhouensis]|uniref:Peptidase C60 sortase A and B n=1 Tax=Lentzea guizhouensis TaxID=1586287 RepID=A0A1B2HY19_9PSEU|nr:class F sortase [Lentzea guizhouensis]ANZ42628.1 peptidase C60 sortase A and B [Lentzea guizhouensis]